MNAKNMAGHVIRQLHQMSTQVYASHMQAAGFDLTPVQFAAMDALSAQPGLDQATIAASIACDRATTGGVIDRLEQKGLVERVVNEKDRRARVVTLTDQGRDLFEQALPIVAGLQVDILQALSPDERSDFLRLAKKAVQGAQNGDAPRT